MNKKIHKKRDDYKDRLLLILQEAIGVPLTYIKHLREKVWLAVSGNERWIIKQFPTYEALQRQIDLTELLHLKGFSNTYSFHPVHRHGPLIIGNKILGVLPYIDQTEQNKFHYRTARNRHDALELLAQFHETTSDFTHLFTNRLKPYNQIEKWERRLTRFKRKIKRLNWPIANQYMDHYINAGEWALEIMYKEKDFFNEEPHVILHGDVVHHNFIRGKDHKLYLIDFDLMSIGPNHIDFLQFCNRILSPIHWSVERLFTYRILSPYKNKTPFLAALIFPSDLFREWNHFMKLSPAVQRNRWPFIDSITFKQFSKRMNYTKELKKRIKNNRLQL